MNTPTRRGFLGRLLGAAAALVAAPLAQRAVEAEAASEPVVDCEALQQSFTAAFERAAAAEVKPSAAGATWYADPNGTQVWTYTPMATIESGPWAGCQVGASRLVDVTVEMPLTDYARTLALMDSAMARNVVSLRQLAPQQRYDTIHAELTRHYSDQG